MEEKFIIEGRHQLFGEVKLSGYKNAAGPLLAASLLTDEPCTISNLPLVEDVFSLISILKEMGADVEWQGEKTIKIKNQNRIDPKKINSSLVSKSRISVLLLGPLASRFKKFKIARPGGDRIGLRPIATHLESFNKLGVVSYSRDNFYEFERKDLKAREIILKEFSVTATENILLAASKIKGKTIIKCAACEPQVQDLGMMLIKMGAKIQGLGTHTIIIEGQNHLEGVEYKVMPDPNEAGTFIAAGAIGGGKIKIINAIPEHLDSFLDRIKDIGAKISIGKNFIEVESSKNFKPAKIQALPYPGFPTDLLPVVVPLLTQAKGKSLIHDPLYENRFNYSQEMRKMGADIEIVDPHRAIIFGKTPLSGVEIESWDIRAGASLVIAGLVAKGKTVIKNVYQIDRGYEKIEEKLQKLGANIKRIKI